MNSQSLKTWQNPVPAFMLIVFVALLLGGCGEEAKVKVKTEEIPAFWKHQVKGDFPVVLDNVKSALIADQFMITDEENLAQGLEKVFQLHVGYGVEKQLAFDIGGFFPSRTDHPDDGDHGAQ